MSAEIPSSISQKTAHFGGLFLNSVRVTPQWYLLGAAAAEATHYTGSWASEKLSEGKLLQAIPPLVFSLCSLGITAFSAGGIYEYTQRYQRFKRVFQERGWSPRIVVHDLDYYCGRRSARLAANDAGYKHEFNTFANLYDSLTRQ